MTPPNIIFILADDMGYGDMSLFNGGLSQTPVLDGLASEGICLTQHYAASPVCNPSRASLLTGRLPHRTGSIDTFDHLGSERLSLRERTIADILKQAGYTTGLVGKFHNGTIGDAYHPNRRGFDEFFGFRGGWQFYFDSRIERNGTPVKPDGRYLTDRLTDEAIGFVTQHQQEPFFLHLAYNCPHFPIEAPADDIAPFTGKFNTAVRTLYGMIRNMDRNIGRLLDTLNRLGLRDNTIVLFTSDNGPDFGGEPAEYSLKRFNCNFNGAKGRTYEGGIRLPMLLRWPDGLPGKRTFDAMVHLSDWFPTLLAMTGVALPAGNLPLDGWNVLRVLRGESGKVNTRRFWQWNRYYPYIGFNAAMRDGDWKLVRPYAPQTYRDEDGPLDMRLRKEPGFLKEIIPVQPRSFFSYGPPLPAELYNLRADPGEQQNLAAQEPERTGRMLRELETWFEEVEADRHRCADAVFKIDDMNAVTIPDVVYGRKFGMALMLDVVKPEKPSGIGVLALSSGGWQSWPESGKPETAEFLKRGQTVFIVMHGGKPKFGITEIVADIQLAVRIVREHPGDYAVDPERLGLFGISSGGNISLLTAAQAGVSDRVGAVACFYPPTDFLNYGEPGKLRVPYRPPEETADDATLARAWSPVTHFTAAMPPTLIIHGDADVQVPIQQARAAAARLREIGVEHRLEERPGQPHGWPDMSAEYQLCADWFAQHLRHRE